MTRNRLTGRRFVRALLVALLTVVAAPGLLTLLGAFAPRLPVVGPFAALLNVGLPWVWASVLGGAGLGLAALAVGGRRGTALLVGICLLGAAGAAVVTAAYSNFAAQNQLAFSMTRLLETPSTRGPDVIVPFASVDGADLRAGIWLPPQLDANAPARRPAVLYVHGGAFVAGGLNMRPRLFDAWSASGLFVVDIEYRLAPPPRWDQAPRDVLCALAWIAKPAVLERFGFDPGRVVLVGESAGGNLALVAGFAAGTDNIPPSCSGTPLKPAGIVAVAPTADLRALWEAATLTAGDLRFPEIYTGGPPSTVPEHYTAASPGWLIEPNVPPTLLLTGEQDRLVPLHTVRALTEQLVSAGADVTLLVAPFTDHGFDGQGFGAQIEERLVPAFVQRVTNS